ncbi:MAG: 16S rRNA (guanine(527)-N(7))-methyltransferase RsmG [Clostridia bacterium]|nr:16S rRNA (guanine(527)-N(7))-methyltransferase RsmG [Clostridia bacterium]
MDTDMNEQEFNDIFKRIFNENRLGRFEPFSGVFFRLTEKLLSSPVNVTAIKNTADIIALHYADSLLGERFVPDNSNCVDVGSGGGFPALPLAAVRGDIKMTALDSTAKKLTFIRAAADHCGIDNIGILHARAEEAFEKRSELRESFDCVTARAVAPMDMLCELCLPAIRTGGVFIAYRGADGMNEFKTSKKAIRILGGETAEVYDTKLLSESGENQRYIFVIKKIAGSPDMYPRKFAKIQKEPIN